MRHQSSRRPRRSQFTQLIADGAAVRVGRTLRIMADKRELVQPPPVQINVRRITAVGTALFFAGFVVLLPFYAWLGRHDHRIWLWTCLAGAVLGLFGYSIMRRHRGEGRTI